MATMFDTLAYAKALQESGISANQAEAHARAARDFVMPELATKSDISALRSEIESVKGMIERQGLLVTIRLGGLLVVGVGALAAIIKLT